MGLTERGDDSADFLARVIEEYFERLRCGERPQLEEFIQKYPEISDLLRTVIPGLQAAEQVPGVSAGSVSPRASLGDFHILREIGRGGMGVVYEAEQVSLGRRVALKIMLHHASATSEQRGRFQREARSAARLHHTNIVPIFGVGEAGSDDYYVMQLIQGKDLGEVLGELRQMRNLNLVGQDSAGEVSSAPPDAATMSFIAQSLWHGDFGQASREAVGESPNASSPKIVPQVPGDTARGSSGSFSSSASRLSVTGPESRSRDSRNATYWASVARIGLQVAGALQYAHDHSILHRDIKPSNLLLDDSGTVWVSDFGLAKAMDQQQLTHTGDVLGTLRYMPPEAFRGRTDQRSDLYSLGITIYEMLVLRPAYNEADRHRLIVQIMAASPERLEHIDPSIPRDLVTIVHKAIEREPAHRYQSAQEMEDDFARLLADEPIKARRTSTIERIARWSRKNKGMAAVIASVATLLILGTVASLMFAMYLSREREAAEYGKYVLYILATNSRAEKHSRSALHAREILADIPAHYRNWEWAYLANKVWRPRTPDTKQTVYTTEASSPSLQVMIDRCRNALF